MTVFQNQIAVKFPSGVFSTVNYLFCERIVIIYYLFCVYAYMHVVILFCSDFNIERHHLVHADRNVISRWTPKYHLINNLQIDTDSNLGNTI